MLGWFITHWKVVSIVILLLAAISGLWLGYNAAYSKGYTKAVAEYEAARVEAAKAAQKKIAENTRNQSIVNERIDNAPNANCSSNVYPAIVGVRSKTGTR